MVANATPPGVGGGLNDMPGYPVPPPTTIAVDVGDYRGIERGMLATTANGVTYVVTKVDASRIELSIAPSTMVAFDPALAKAEAVSVGYQVGRRGKVVAPRCLRCNSINAHGASRCTRCGGRIR